MEKKYEEFYDLASKASFRNWHSVKRSEFCGCYFCCRIFPSSEVTECIPDNDLTTAVCPHCGIDSVIGDNSGIPIRKDVLEELRRFWFSQLTPKK